MFSISSDLLNDLRLVSTLPASLLNEFLSISLESLRTGLPSKSKLLKVSEKLASAAAAEGGNAASPALEWTDISNLLLALIQYLLDATKMNATQEEFVKALEELALNEEQKQCLQQTYSTHHRDLRTFLSNSTIRLPHYHNLEWRLDVQLGSRHLRNAVVPSYLLELDIRSNNGSATSSSGSSTEDNVAHSTHTFQADFATLSKMAESLEQAVKEANNKHARRILRYVK